MTDINYKEIWWNSMRDKHPDKTDDEIRQLMKGYGKRNTGENSHLKGNSDKARELGKLGGKTRWQKSE